MVKMNYGAAIELAKSGKKVVNSEWPLDWHEKQWHLAANIEKKSISLCGKDGVITPNYAGSQEDIFSDNWVEIEISE